MAEEKIQRMSWTKLAEKLSQPGQPKLDSKILKKECRPILRRLNALSRKKNSRVLWPRQIRIILKHLGYTEDEILGPQKQNNNEAL